MAVKVTIRHGSPAHSEISEDFPKGRGIFITNGHLIVGDHPSQQMADTIAMFAPEKWENAVVTKDEKPKS